MTLDEYLPEKFAKLVGATFANKDDLKRNHLDYYTKKFTFLDFKPNYQPKQEVMTAEEKHAELEALISKSGLSDELKVEKGDFHDDIDEQVS